MQNRQTTEKTLHLSPEALDALSYEALDQLEADGYTFTVETEDGSIHRLDGEIEVLYGPEWRIVGFRKA